MFENYISHSLYHRSLSVILDKHCHRLKQSHVTLNRVLCNGGKAKIHDAGNKGLRNLSPSAEL